MAPAATFKPAVILHGGAGGIQRSTLPPELYAQYHASLLAYLRSTNELLQTGACALDAAVHAVSLMEDDELFNCGRGSVFTSAGTIEMEASVMVTSLRGTAEQQQPGSMKRGAGVMGIKTVRHPIQLARESLVRTGYDADGRANGDGGNMHSQLVGAHVEQLARDWGLETKPAEWFWTQRRWDEHCRGLRGEKEPVSMSQGTVGCVCLDQWGNLAVATSTGGMTNKAPGRIGDTPTLGAGFWAEAWDVAVPPCSPSTWEASISLSKRLVGFAQDASQWWCCRVPSLLDAPPPYSSHSYSALPTNASDGSDESDGPDRQSGKQPPAYHEQMRMRPATAGRRRAMAVSGTGNGDSFLRIAAARTVSAMLRFSRPYSQSSSPCSLAAAVTAVAGPDGELQRSAGQRWDITGEGMGGMIGIEAEAAGDGSAQKTEAAVVAADGLGRGKIVFDFNCGGMWRAWVEEGADGKDRERVMVFRDEY